MCCPTVTAVAQHMKNIAFMDIKQSSNIVPPRNDEPNNVFKNRNDLDVHLYLN